MIFSESSVILLSWKKSLAYMVKVRRSLGEFPRRTGALPAREEAGVGVVVVILGGARRSGPSSSDSAPERDEESSS